MTPLDPHNPSPYDPIDQDDLIAFHLNELPRQQARAVNRALRINPKLQAESIAIAATLHAFPKHEPAPPLDAATLDRHWQTLLPNLAPHTPAPIPPRTFFPRTVFPRWTLPTLAGSALVATTLFVAWHYTHHTQPPTIATLTTPSSTITTPAPPTNPQPQQPSSSQSNPFNPLPLTPHRVWPSTSAPLETATANPAPPIFPTQAPLTPTSPSTAPTQTTAAPPLNTTQTQPPTQPLAQPPAPSAISTGRPLRTSTPHHSPTTELTLAMFGNITAGRSSSYTSGFGTSQITQTATPAVGALASFRQQFSPRLGYRLTTTYFSPSFNYSTAGHPSKHL